jgi:[glutamine synthetase] adenylyltransferase / [glutamine synthetase]-adenylyl-L-tyrosine phosphorylase
MTSSAKDDADQHRLAARFVDGPHVSALDKAEQRLRDWLTDLAAEQAAAIDDLIGRFPRARTILLGIAEASPYLFDLLRADGARAVRLLGCEPEPHLAHLLEKTCRDVAAASSEADVMQLLRRMKAEAALLIALCDIGGVWPVMRVTAALTDLAVASVQSALRFLLRQEAARGRLSPPNLDTPEDESGLIVLAMGKMGAGELNYSSDIDLIVFFDSAATTLAPDIEPQPFFVRVTQSLARMLQQRTGDGYVFRVDLRLRPDPASTQVAISIASALHYYEREGRTWERAAMIKARPCAGDPKAGEALLAEIAPFVWRKHLDFAALADVHDMKRQMQTFRGQSEIAVEGHNVKVGRGGIREIEFFAQTQQLIAGGRHPELRVRPTLEALDVLASSNWITFEARDELTKAYEFLRRVEHRLQMMADEQTHALPDDVEAVQRFACFFGYENRAAFAKDLLGHLDVVQGHYGKLFEGDPTGTEKLPAADYSAGPDDPRLIEHLIGLGFKKPVAVAATVRQWMTGDYRALLV